MSVSYPHPAATLLYSNTLQLQRPSSAASPLQPLPRKPGVVRPFTAGPATAAGGAWMMSHAGRPAVAAVAEGGGPPGSVPLSAAAASAGELQAWRYNRRAAPAVAAQPAADGATATADDVDIGGRAQGEGEEGKVGQGRRAVTRSWSHPASASGGSGSCRPSTAGSESPTTAAGRPPTAGSGSGSEPGPRAVPRAGGVGPGGAGVVLGDPDAVYRSKKKTSGFNRTFTPATMFYSSAGPLRQ